MAPVRDRLDGKVALITGAARGQGRAHAVRLAGLGAGILAVDLCADVESMGYPMGTAADLDETARLVRDKGGRIVTAYADVRSPAELDDAVANGSAELGGLHIVVANAGIVRLHPGGDPRAIWRDTIDVDLTGVWNTICAALPALRACGSGGAIVITNSIQGLRPSANPIVGAAAYAAAKGGLVGLMRQLAATLAPESIRVNSVHPTGVRTGMTMNEPFLELVSAAASAEGNALSALRNPMPIDMLEPDDISDAVAFLVSDSAKWITGAALPVDAGRSVA